MSKEADARHRAWMQGLLDRAAGHFGLTRSGEPVFGWNDRSVGTSADRAYGERVWLRVMRENIWWADGSSWTGNTDADAINGVPKPRVLEVLEWDEAYEGDRYRVRAEVMTLLSGAPCSATPVLREQPDLSEAWWSDLTSVVRSVATTPTSRIRVTREDVTRRLLVFFGDRTDPAITSWTTAHGDLHWANLYCPELAITDWEGWGAAPAGFDPAVLLCHSLLVPKVAHTVRALFADVLDTPDGRKTQLYVVAWMLLRIEHGDDPETAMPLHRHAHAVMAEMETHG